jgi:hypothetical protein
MPFLGRPFSKAILRPFGRARRRFRVGWGVSEVLGAFLTSLAGVCGSQDDRINKNRGR